MKRLKLFPKIFLYTFGVMLFITVIAHIFLYLFAPLMQVSTGSIWVDGIILENSLDTSQFIKEVIRKALPFSLVFCTPVSFLCSLFFSRAITTPVKQISRTAEQMARLDQQARCPVRSHDEIGALAVNVNTLYTDLLSTIKNLELEQEKVRRAEQSKIDFLRAASHELKTPVTALNAILENMILGVGKYKDRDTCLIQCRDITAQLTNMIKEVLDTTKIDFAAERQKAETFDLSEQLLTFCEPYQLISKLNQIHFQVDVYESCPLCLPCKSLEKILSNLFSNAVSYTKAGHCIRAALYADRFIIENECQIIEAEKLPRLFEPFYRPDYSRDRKDGGNGLGLYIVDVLAKALELCYTFEPMPSGEGMRFTIYF